MKVKNYLISFLIFIMCTSFLLSCEDSSATSSIKLNIETNVNNNKDINRTIIPDGATMDIKKYVIIGAGTSDDDRFKITVTEPTYTIKGLRLGDWCISVVGKNEDGIDIVEGSTITQLTDKPSTVRIELNHLIGGGIVSLSFNWDTAKIKSPSIKLESTNQYNRVRKEELTSVDYENGRALFEKQMASGSYTLKAKLYDGDTAVSGCVEAIRIIPHKTSEGSIFFNIGDKISNSNNSNPIIIKNKTGLPIPCKIVNVAEKVGLNSTIKPLLVAKDNSPLNEYNITWYLDGNIIGSGENCSLKPQLGDHRLDVIVENEKIIGGTSSSSFNFSVILDSPAYIPKCINTIESGQNNLNIGGSMHLAFLNDGKFIIYCGKTQTLQICRIVNNNIEVLKTYENSGSMPLTNVKDIKICQKNNKVYISEEATKSVYIYNYNYNNLIKYYSNNDYNNKASNFGNIFIREFDFFVDDPKSNYFRQYLLDPKSESENFAVCCAYNGGNFSCSQGKISPDKTGICRTSALGKVSFSFICKGIEDLRIVPYAIEGPTYSSVESICGAALSWNKFIIGANNKIDYYKIPNSNISSYQKTDSYMGGVQKIPSLNKISDFVFLTKKSVHDSSKIVDKIYALCNSKNTILVFNADEDSDKLQYLGQESLGTFSPDKGFISPNKEFLIILSNNSSNLKLFKINKQ